MAVNFFFITVPQKDCAFFVAVTILLAMSVYQIIVTDKLPPTSNFVPVIGKHTVDSVVSCSLVDQQLYRVSGRCAPAAAISPTVSNCMFADIFGRRKDFSRNILK